MKETGDEAGQGRRLRGWIRFWLGVFLAGVVLTGAAAAPLVREAGLAYRGLHYFGIFSGPLHDQIQHILAALLETQARYPFLFFGTDWRAFGHLALAVMVAGAWRDPVRNVWVVQAAMAVCALVLPFVLVSGWLRGVPWWWQAAECLLGVLGWIPLVIARRLIRRLERECA